MTLTLALMLALLETPQSEPYSKTTAILNLRSMPQDVSETLDLVEVAFREPTTGPLHNPFPNTSPDPTIVTLHTLTLNSTDPTI